MNTPQNVPASLHQATDPWAAPTATSLALIAAGPTEIKPAETPARVRNSDSCPICQATGPCPSGAIHR